MDRTTTFGLIMVFAGALTVGCGEYQDECEKAAEILNDCGQDTVVAECDGKVETKRAQCVLDNPDGACSEELNNADALSYLDCFLEADD